jgi:hypothetical protein
VTGRIETMSTLGELLQGKGKEIRQSFASRALSGQVLPVPQLGSAQRFLLLSILIGIFSGLLVVCFHFLIEFISWEPWASPPGKA